MGNFSRSARVKVRRPRCSVAGRFTWDSSPPCWGRFPPEPFCWSLCAPGAFACAQSARAGSGGNKLGVSTVC